jgi:hypothetical protein
MSAGRRMAVLEREAQNLLREQGYDSVCVSDAFQNSRYIPYNLIARRAWDSSGDETRIVKIKIALRRLTAIDASVFCRAEMVQVQKIRASLPPELEGARYECWISVPPDSFQQFAITGEGIREVLPGEHRDGSYAGDRGEPCSK